MFYKKREKSHHLFSTSLLSSLLIGFNLISIYFYLDYIDLVISIPNKYYVLLFFILVWSINYYGFIKKERFLKYNFKKDLIGGGLIVLYILLSVLMFVSIANLNREKIENTKKESPNIPKKESLEKKISKWFEE